MFFIKKMKFLALLAIISIVFCSGCTNRQTTCDGTTNHFPNLPVFDSHSHIIITNHNFWVEINITDPNQRPDPPHDQLNQQPHPDFVLQYALVQCGCNAPSSFPSNRPVIHVPVADLGNTAPDVFPMLDVLNSVGLMKLSLSPRYIATQTVVDELLERLHSGEKMYFIDDYDRHQRNSEVEIISFFFD